MKKLFKSLLLSLLMALLVSGSVSAAPAGEQESNNSRTSAQTINVNTEYQGNISTGNDEDWYKIVLKKPGVVWIDFKLNENTLSYDKYLWEVALLNSEGNFIAGAGNEDYWNKATEYGKPKKFGLPAGTYFVRIKERWPQIFATTPYTFRACYKETNDWEKEDWEKEENNDLETANPIELGKNYYGAILSEYDEDFYKLTIKKKGTLKVKFKHEEVVQTSDWFLYVMDSNGKAITGIGSRINLTMFYGREIGQKESPKYDLSPGTYYIKIKPSVIYTDQPYRFSCSFTESGGKVATTGKTNPTAKPKSVRMNVKKATLDVKKKKTIQLKATVSPANASQKVTWTPGNKNVVIVDKNGLVTAAGRGTATVTAKTSNNKKATCRITVKGPIKVTKVRLNKNSGTIDLKKKNKTIKLKATLTPTNATNKKVTWNSSNTKVATVNSSGKVTGISVGTTKITVTTDDGKKFATCQVTVKDTTKKKKK